MRRLLPFLAAFVLLAATSTPAAAYDNGNWVWEPSTPGATGDSAYYIPVCLHSNFDGPNGGWNMVSSQHYALSRAMDTWNSVPGSLTYVASNHPCSYYASNDWRYLQVGWTNTDTPDRVGYFTVIEGGTGCQPITINCMESAAIWLESPSINWYYINDAPYPSPGEPYYGAIDYKGLVTHELGHAASLSHEWPWDDCMRTMAGPYRCYSLASGVARSLAQDDWNGYYAYWYGR